MSKHTPGPWSVTARSNNMIDVIHANRAPGAITLALCRVQARQSWLKEAEANARLIAAAPEMLEALETAYYNEGGYQAWKEQVRAAIRKATGEKQ